MFSLFHLNDEWVCLVETENYLKSPDCILKSIENRKMFLSLQETPSFTYQIVKTKENKAS